VRRAGAGLEVLWSRRPDDRRWFGGFWGFPVGRIRQTDSVIPNSSTDELLPPEAYGCAARELFEELGVFPVDGEWRETTGADAAESGTDHRLRQARGRVRDGERSFSGLLREMGVRIDSSLLHPVGEWSTPSWFPSGFSTEFFAATLPTKIAGRLIERIDATEYEQAKWTTPSEALKDWRNGEAFVSTPIRYLLRALEQADGWRWSEHGRRRELVVTDDWLEPRRCADRSDIEIARGVRWMALPSQTITATNRTNCWIVGHSDLVIIDPGTPYSAERAVLRSTIESLRSEGRSVKSVVLTHHHGDHVAAADWLAEHLEVPVWAHPETARKLSDPEVVQRDLTEGSTISLGDRRVLHAWHTPGHAPGHLAFMLEPDRHLIAGDLVARGTTVLIDPDEGHMGDYLESLRRVKRANPDSLLPGHGHPICHVDAVLERYLGHRQRRERQILEVLRQRTAETGAPVSAADLVPEVYADAPRRRWPLAMRSLEAHLIHLCEQDQAVRRHGNYVARD
jgi:glyoxylase-like metal-dependent hydrolase (beta-lactamase superfamily II)/8-oxo-dGTP pyrophosphatase MutT (NUDIX family)